MMYLTKQQFLTYYVTGGREVRIFPRIGGKPQIKASVDGISTWLPVTFVVPDGGGAYEADQNPPMLPDILPAIKPFKGSGLTDEQKSAYNAWRERLQKSLPNLASRVFALRTKMYAGCGFHWGMEKNLGHIIRLANDYDTLPQDMSIVIAQEVITEELFNDIRKAEKSADEWLAKQEHEQIMRMTEG